jgi:hypothetical protein
MATEKNTPSSLLLDLASAIRALERSDENNRRMWQNAVNDRLEALALMIDHGVVPSTYEDERAAQVEECNLGKIYRAGGTF